ncbi:transposase, partial [Bacillaceae bacterium SIJ1]|uniref:transposase n=1 Tax=Litoribacterium kuwaitense TaxID=1398745 RepID=UPI0013ECE2DD
LSMSPELRKAYELKEAYCTWFEKAKIIGSNQIAQVKQELKDYCENVEEAGIPEMIQALKPFKNWQTEILNSFVFGYNNGFIEGLNNKTKVIKRNAYGIPRYDRFRYKILLSQQLKHIQDFQVG